jgi:enoyl-CoA hydratase/carnithine racemase
MSAPEPLGVELRDGCLRLTLPGPERLNALRGPTMVALDEALARAEADEAVRVVVIAGTDGNFCAGADLLDVLDQVEGDGGTDWFFGEFLPPMGAALARVRRLPKPVIAAVEGVCCAGGLELVVSCDLIVATESARFADRHADLAMVPAAGGTAGLVRTIGRARAKELLWTGVWWSGAQMAEAGLVTRLVPDGALAETVDELVATLVGKEPVVLAEMKRLVEATATLPVDDAVELEQRGARELFQQPPFKRALDRFAGRKEGAR